jgi:hypothetical protein
MPRMRAIMPPSATEFLSTGDLARRLGVTLKAIARLDQRGWVPEALWTPVGRLWTRPQIEIWIRSGCPPRPGFPPPRRVRAWRRRIRPQMLAST